MGTIFFNPLMYALEYVKKQESTKLFTGFPIVQQRLEKVAPTEQYDEKTKLE